MSRGALASFDLRQATFVVVGVAAFDAAGKRQHGGDAQLVTFASQNPWSRVVLLDADQSACASMRLSIAAGSHTFRTPLDHIEVRNVGLCNETDCGPSGQCRTLKQELRSLNPAVLWIDTQGLDCRIVAHLDLCEIHPWILMYGQTQCATHEAGQISRARHTMAAGCARDSITYATPVAIDPEHVGFIRTKESSHAGAALQIRDVAILSTVAGLRAAGAAPFPYLLKAERFHYKGERTRSQAMYLDAAVSIGRMLDAYGSRVDRLMLTAHLTQDAMARMAHEGGWRVIDFTPLGTAVARTGVDMACFYHPLFNKSEAIAQGRAWNDRNHHPERRDGVGTYYKLLLFAMTDYKRILSIDVDVGIFDNPDTLLLSSPNLPIIMSAEPKAGLQKGVGTNSHIFYATPSNATLRRLLQMASDGCYWPFTNGEQDILESIFSPSSAHPFPAHDHTSEHLYRRHVGALERIASSASEEDAACYRRWYLDAANLSLAEVRSHWLTSGFVQRRTLLCTANAETTDDLTSRSVAPEPLVGRVSAGLVEDVVLPPPRDNPQIPDAQPGLTGCFGAPWAPEQEGKRHEYCPPKARDDR